VCSSQRRIVEDTYISAICGFGESVYVSKASSQYLVGFLDLSQPVEFKTRSVHKVKNGWMKQLTGKFDTNGKNYSPII